MPPRPHVGRSKRKALQQRTSSVETLGANQQENRREIMNITSDRVRNIFKGLENGDGAAFFEQVADDVDWTVMGTHPLAGHYPSKKAFIAGTFAKLGQVLADGAYLDSALVARLFEENPIR